jgi:DNA-binding transcriptional MocR family regulator
MKNTPYSVDEDNLILKDIENNISIEDIAYKNQRSVSSVTTRLKKLAINMVKENSISFNEASEKVNLPAEVIQQYYSSKIKKTKEEIRSERKDRKQGKKELRQQNKEILLSQNNSINKDITKNKDKYNFRKELKEKKEIQTIVLLEEIRDYLKIIVDRNINI